MVEGSIGGVEVLCFQGRRLYRMKRKSQSLQLKVAPDDKVSCCDSLLANAFIVVLTSCLFGAGI
ncbi:hypothetical protein RchiOBHm_Chr5g0049421 [Rosa chinensis]|uniref:Uncharacterized protein n=1 Tax=Rosa chinensis TaxID=74649 RepID=A0A2P6QEV8_ROSCH|nr:hypothetical protein RchiOBHm_Chr5g0049421 [Rosa chinensis]